MIKLVSAYYLKFGPSFFPTISKNLLNFEAHFIFEFVDALLFVQGIIKYGAIRALIPQCTRYCMIKMFFYDYF